MLVFGADGHLDDGTAHAFVDGALPDEALDAVAAGDGRRSGGAGPADGGLAAVRSRLERVFQQVYTRTSAPGIPYGAIGAGRKGRCPGAERSPFTFCLKVYSKASR